jgi:hypothetical protein
MSNAGKLNTPVSKTQAAHAILYGLSVFLFGLASLMLRLKNVVQAYYIVQLAVVIIIFGGPGCGVWLI